MKVFLEKCLRQIGEKSSLLLLGLAILTFTIVVLRYVFRASWVSLQELMVYLHAITFLCGSAWGFYKSAHVRVDVIYARKSFSQKLKLNKWGGLLLLCPTCLTIFVLSWPYVIDSWSVFEGSTDSAGLPLIFLLKSFLLLFSISGFLLGLQMFLNPADFTEPESQEVGSYE